MTKILLHDTNLKSLIMTNKIESGVYQNRKYYDKHKNWDDVLWDLEHDDVLKNLSRGKTFFKNSIEPKNILIPATFFGFVFKTSAKLSLLAPIIKE